MNSVNEMGKEEREIMVSRFLRSSLAFTAIIGFSSFARSSDSDFEACKNLAPKNIVDQYDQEKAVWPKQYDLLDMFKIGTKVTRALHSDPAVKAAAAEWAKDEKDLKEGLEERASDLVKK